MFLLDYTENFAVKENIKIINYNYGKYFFIIAYNAYSRIVRYFYIAY